MALSRRSRLARRILFGGAAVLGMLWLVLAPPRLPWGTLAWFLYFAPAVVLVLLSCLPWRLFLGRLNHGLLRYQFQKATRETGTLARFREAVGGRLYMLSTTVVWPVLFLRVPFIWRRLRGSQDLPGMFDLTIRLADMRLKPRILFDAGVVFLVVGSAYGLALAGIAPKARGVFQVAIVFVLLTLLAYMAGPESFAGQLRRSGGQPFLRLLWIALSITSTAVLSLLALRYGSRPPSGSEVMDLLRDLFLWPKEAWRLARRQDATLLDVQVVATGALLSTSILKALPRVSDLKRDAEHLEELAGAHLKLGHYEEALGWLTKIRNPRQSTWSLSVSAHLGLDQLDQALECARRALDVDEGRKRLLKDPYAYTAMALVDIERSSSLGRELVERWIRAGAQDARVLGILLAFRYRGLISDIDINELFGREKVRKQLPLAFVAFLFWSGQRALGRQKIQRIRPRTPLDHAALECLLLVGKITDPRSSLDEDARFFQQWSRKNVPRFREAAHNAEDDIDRVWLVMMGGIGLLMSRQLVPAHEEEWRSTMAETSAMLRSAEAGRLGNAIYRLVHEVVSATPVYT